MIETATAVLQVLIKGPACGTDLQKRYAKQTGVSLSLSNLYHALHRLEKEGALRSKEEGRGVGRPMRVYQLTAVGRKSAAKDQRMARKIFGI